MFKKLLLMLLSFTVTLSMIFSQGMIITAEEETNETEDTGTRLSLETASVKVEGVLPEGAQLITESKEDPFSAPVKKMKLMAKSASLDDANVEAEDETAIEIEKKIFVYDIKIVKDEEKIQPTQKVRLTFSEVEYPENGYVEIYHILDDPQAILSNSNAVAVKDASFASTFPVEADIVKETTGEEDTVYLEFFTSYGGTVERDENGKVTIETGSFSTFYILSGNSENGRTSESVTTIDDGSGTNVYYVSPGTHLILARENLGNAWWGADRNNVDGVRFQGKYTSGYTTYTSDVSTTAYISGSGSIVQGHNFTQGDYLVLDVASTATIGSTFTITSYRGPTMLTMMSKKTLQFIVMSEVDVLNNIYNSDSGYGVYLTVMRDPTGGIPGEPCIASVSFDYASSGMSGLSESKTTFSAKGKDIIDSSILTNPDFISSQDGTNTRGIADATGTKTLAVLKANAINWNTMMDKIVAINSNTYWSGFPPRERLYTADDIYATDGALITNANKNNYEIVPYVVKIQTAYDIGWHIDCYVTPKNSIQVSYNPNLPSGYSVANINVPLSKSGTSPLNMTAGSPAIDNGSIAVNDTVNATDIDGEAVELTFLGWNSAADGSGTDYVPGTSYVFSADTVLYANWEASATGIIEIHKIVEVMQGSSAPPAGDTFTITLNLANNSSKPAYTIYDASDEVQSTGTMTSKTQTLTFQDGWWIKYTGIKNGMGYTVTEAAKTNYTQSITNGSGTVTAGAVTIVTVKNTYNHPVQCSLTIHHYEEGTTNELADDETYSVNYGTQIVPSSYQKTIEGYSYSSSDPTTSFEMTEDASITLYYQGSQGSYLVKHYLQNLTATGYDLDDSATETLTGDLGASTQAAARTYTGFTDLEFDQKIITADDSDTVEIYYNRNSYAWTVKHVEKDNETNVLREDEMGRSPYQTSVSVNADDTITGYSFDSKSADTITIDVENNLAYVYYTRNEHQVTYYVEDEIYGEVETYAYDETITPRSLPVKTNYDFDGWYSDAEYTALYTIPEKMPDDDITVYGRFIRKTAPLTITKSGLTAGDSAIFVLKGPDLSQGLTLVLNGEHSSITVGGLCVGEEYTLEEISGWSWKYEPVSLIEVTMTQTGNLISVSNALKDDPLPWLNCEAVVKNLFSLLEGSGGNENE